MGRDTVPPASAVREPQSWDFAALHHRSDHPCIDHGRDEADDGDPVLGRAGSNTQYRRWRNHTGEQKQYPRHFIGVNGPRQGGQTNCRQKFEETEVDEDLHYDLLQSANQNIATKILRNAAMQIGTQFRWIYF